MLATLLDRSAGDALPLPRSLAERYGGALRVPDPVVYANFVSTLDGVVSYGTPGSEAAAAVSEGHAGDRFVLALLRAVADVIVVGAGTLRTERGSVWTPEHVFHEAGTAFAELRRAMRLPERAPTVIVTASGEVDLSLPAFRSGVRMIVATTERGARRLGDAPAAVEVRPIAAEGSLASDAILDLARREGGGARILTEGGPRLLGRFLEDGVVDELYLTIAPRLAGRSDELRRIALVEGTAFAAADAPRGRVVSVKSADDYLFTRFSLRS